MGADLVARCRADASEGPGVADHEPSVAQIVRATLRSENQPAVFYHRHPSGWYSMPRCPLSEAKEKTCARIELFRFGPVADIDLHKTTLLSHQISFF